MSSWDRAFHAYGPASGGDELLDVLRNGEEETYAGENPGVVWWRQPYSFLWSALYCGGRITPATVLGLRHLLEAIPASDFGGTDRTLRWAAVWWIRDVLGAALAGTPSNDARLAGARRNEQIVDHWLDDHLARERSIFEWDDSDEPGQVQLATAHRITEPPC